MLLGMLQWIVTIGRPELSQLVASLNYFGACHKEAHLDLAVRAFRYIKMTFHEVIAIDSRPIKFKRSSPDFPKLIIDFLKDYYDSKEELDLGFPLSFGPILESTILVDSDHAHDLLTHCSLTGLIGFMDSSPVTWSSQRQGYTVSSTFAAEFSALRTAIEEDQSICRMLCCLGCIVPSDGSCPTRFLVTTYLLS